MKQISKKELDEILRLHELWIDGKEEGIRADLRGADLRGADLRKADLTEADLIEADLRGADLRKADLRKADLRKADLTEADLIEANLRGADLTGAKLSEADLIGAKLIGAKLSEADLTGAKLIRADLRGADLRKAYLREAKLADVIANSGTAFYGLQCPEEGSFIGWKKVWYKNEKYIAKLLILEDSKRSSATSRMCRCSKAKVLEIQTLDGTKTDITVSYSNYDTNFTYTVGKTVEIKDFDDNRWNEWTTGIHFFITKDEAVKYC